MSRLKHLTHQSRRTMYRVKRGLPHDYLARQFANPNVQMPLE